MKALAIGTLIDAMRAQTSRLRERTRVAEWCRHNATVQRALPPLPDNDEAELGVLYAVALGSDSEANGAAKGGGESGAGSSAGGTGLAPTAPAAGATQSGNASGDGQARQPEVGGTSTHAGSGSGAAATAGGGAAGSDGPRSTKTPWKWLAAGVAAGAGLLGGGAGIYALASQWLAGNGSGDSAVIVQPAQPGDTSLYQYLEDHGYHLPPDGNPDG